MRSAQRGQTEEITKCAGRLLHHLHFRKTLLMVVPIVRGLGWRVRSVEQQDEHSAQLLCAAHPPLKHRHACRAAFTFRHACRAAFTQGSG